MSSQLGSRLRASLIVLAVLALVAGCTRPATTTPSSPPVGSSQVGWSDKTFVKVFLVFPSDIDPHGKLYTITSETVIRSFYESLIDYNPQTQKLEGVLATSWESAPDAKSFTFKLRTGVKFHDGSDLTAEAVKLSLERIVDQGSVRAQLLRELEGVDAVDASTVRIRLKSPSAVFLTQVPEFPIASADALKAHFAKTDQWFLTHEAGTAAYTLDAAAYDPGTTTIRLKPFDKYWRGWGRQGFVTTLPEGATHLGKIEVRLVPESATQRLLLESGEAHFMLLFPLSYMSQMASHPLVNTLALEAYRVSLLPLNVASGPLKDVRLRQMLKYAFPYKAYQETYYQGRAQPAAGPVNPKLMPDPSLQPVQQDLAKAKQLLTEAGYGPGQLTLTYAHPTGQEEQLQPGVLLQDALRQIGVELKLQVMPFANIAALSAAGAAQTPDIMTLINTPKGIDPGIGMLQTFFHSKNDGIPYNWGHYKNANVDKLLDDAQKLVTEQQRLDLYRQAQRIVVDEIPALFLAFPNRWAAMSKQVGGYWLSPVTLDRDPWYDMYWVK